LAENKEGDYLQDQNVDGTITLKLMYVKMWNGIN